MSLLPGQQRITTRNTGISCSEFLCKGCFLHLRLLHCRANFSVNWLRIRHTGLIIARCTISIALPNNTTYFFISRNRSDIETSLNRTTFKCSNHAASYGISFNRSGVVTALHDAATLLSNDTASKLQRRNSSCTATF